MKLSPIEDPYDFMYKNKQIEIIEKEQHVREDNSKLNLGKIEDHPKTEPKR
jgi:hypothetical protein